MDIGEVEGADIRMCTCMFLTDQDKTMQTSGVPIIMFVVRLLPSTSTSCPPDGLLMMNETMPYPFFTALSLPWIIVNTNGR